MLYSKFNEVPEDAYLNIVLGQGIFTKSFDPATGAVGNTLFATDGGANFQATPNIINLAEGIDGLHPNIKEFQELDYWSVQISGTGRTIDPDVVALLLGAADIDGTDATKIVPRNYFKDTDFNDDFWWIGKIGKTGDGTDATFLAIHMLNTISTGGMQLQSASRNKAGFPFTFMAHYSMDYLNDVPFEVYSNNPT